MTHFGIVQEKLVLKKRDVVAKKNKIMRKEDFLCEFLFFAHQNIKI